MAGLSTQDSEYQKEAAERLRLPFPLLSDADGRLTEALNLPVLTASGEWLLKRLTLVVSAPAAGQAATIEHVSYPFPPGPACRGGPRLARGPSRLTGPRASPCA